MLIRIKRETLDHAAIGVLYIDGTRECHSLELAWRDNKPRISCIPAGTYRVGWVKSPRLGRYTLRVHGVPCRSGILIHPANWQEELKGCIALGIRSAVNPEQLMDSRRTVERVEKKVCAALSRGEAVTLEIINPEGKA